MNVVSRGIRNAFRNTVRTLSIVSILGLSIGLSLTMLVAHQAVNNKIRSVKASLGTTVTIAPAGFSGFSQVNNSLTTSQLRTVSSLTHVTSLTESLTDRLTTIGSSTPSFGRDEDSNSNNQTSLTSPVKLNANGRGSRLFIAGGGSLPTNFTPPVSIVGTNNPANPTGNAKLTIKRGNTIDGSKDTNNALVSNAMATKNNLQIGSTFTAYGSTLSVAGIYHSNTESASNDVIVSLPTEQRLSNQGGDITSALATVDSLDDLSSTTAAIQHTLGSTADVTSSEDQANEVVSPLNSVKSVSLYSLIGAVIAGSVIILLTMIMIVRERKREIGVIKAIGGSNLRIMFQFMTEALTLTVLGAVIGLIIGVTAGTPVTSTLVSNSANSSTSIASNGFPGGGGGQGPAFQGRGGGGFGFRRLNQSSSVRGIKNIHSQIGWSILVYGFGAAVLIALIGSAIAAGLIASIRPSEVMRAE